MKSKALRVASLGLVAGVVAWQSDASGGRLAPAAVVRVPVVGSIDYAQNAFVRRATREARQNGAQTVVFEIDSPGGEIGAMMQIGVHILELGDSGISTVAWVRPLGEEGVGGNAYSAAAYLALCCKHIFMDPTAAMGAATPITFGSEGVQELPEKFVSATREKFRAVAEHNGYPPNLAAAMVDREIEVFRVLLDGQPRFLTPVEIEEAKDRGRSVTQQTLVVLGSHPERQEGGKLLTLTQHQAVEYGIARPASAIGDVYAGLDVKPDRETLISVNWSEALVRFLTSPIVATLLMLVGVLGIWIELKTPGFGVPGITGILAFAVLLFGHHLAGLAEMTEILLVVAGIAFLAVEVFLLPGFGVFGVLGIVAILAGLVLSFQPFTLPSGDRPWESGILLDSLAQIVVAFLAAGVIGATLARFLPRIPILNRIVLQGTLASATGAVAPSQGVSERMIGKTGVAATPLRPGGKAEIGGRFYDVVTDGEYIDQGQPVTIIAVEGVRVVVAKAE